MFRQKPVAVAIATAVTITTIPAYAQGYQTDDIEQIVVTASPFSRSAHDIAATVGQVNRNEILRGGGANLADVLSDVPGVTGSSFAAGASRPVIRGFDASRVRILENGVGSFDVSDVGPDHGVPIDPLSAQKVEVVRGPATLRFGSQAIGGVVNAINNRVPLELPAQTGGEITGSYGTGANARQGSAMIDTKAGDFAFHADGYGRRTGDYDIPGGVQGNSFFRGSGFSGGSSYFIGDSRIGGAVVRSDAKYGIPAGDTYIDMRQTKGLFGSSLALNAGALTTLNVDGGYADYKHSEIDPATNDILSTFIDKEWDARAEALFGSIGPFVQSALGLQVQHKDFSALGEGGDFLFPTTTKTVAGFVFTEAELSQPLRLQLGARVEHVTVNGTPASDLATRRAFTPISGSVGIVYKPSDILNLGLNLTSAARAPGQTELYARGPHDGPGTFETGDSNLRIERANSLEGTFHLHTDKVVFEGAAWGAKFSNFIYGRLTGNLCDEDGDCTLPDGELKQMFFEQHDATFWGLEGKATAALLQTAQGTVSGMVLADYVRAKLGKLGNVPRMPPYRLGGGLAWTSTSFDAGFQLKYSGSQNKTSFGETPTDDFVTLDAQIGWRPLKAHPGIELSLVGKNLADSVQRNAVSFNKDDVVLPGRDVRFVVRAAF
jgi:iron complex outermembrane receptor protein